MALSVIGSGFGRTGTMSLKGALEKLGFGPCHHMEEVFENPPQVSHWQNIARREPVDWNEVFAGYNSQVDWPGAHVWKELAAAFPDARVVHSVRPDDSWWNSFSKTIGKFLSTYNDLELPPHVKDMCDAMMNVIGDETFNGQYSDRDAALAAYHKRTEQVRAAIPAERLLVFDVAEGWAPLCRFLDVPVPDGPFPHLNSSAEFWELINGTGN